VEQKYGLEPGTRLWLFQAGFLVDQEPELRAELTQFGCVSPRIFGQNIFLCQLTVSALNNLPAANSTTEK
jgi:hypothetical protein